MKATETSEVVGELDRLVALHGPIPLLDDPRDLATGPAAEPVPDDELSRMKENLKGNLMLGLESTAGRMSTLAQQEMYFGRTFDMDEIIDGIDAVDAAQVQHLAQRMFADESICVDVLARRDAADQLTERFADGLALPGGRRLSLG